MIISHIELQHFMSHEATELDLPNQGIVLVSGPNGAGKSALVECVPVACWGESLRGDSPWAQEKGGRCSVVVDAERVCVHRQQSAHPRLAFYQVLAGQQSVSEKFENTTKAQEALSRLLPPFEVWKRSHVISSADVEAFGRSTDAERKRLLEEMLSLDFLDRASEACRADLRGAEKAVNDLHVITVGLQSQVEGLAARLSDAEARCAELPPQLTPEQEEQLLQLRDRVTIEEDALAEAQLRYFNSRDTSANASAKHTEMETRVKRLARKECPECRQRIPPANLANAHMEAGVAKLAVEEAIKEEIAARTAWSAAKGRVDGLRDTAREMDQLLAQAKKQAQQITEAKAKVADLQLQLEEAEDELTSECAQLASWRTALSELQVSDKILSTKGVRAHLLADALEGVEMIANTWLERLAGNGLRLRLSPYAAKSGGGVKESIGMEVTGLGRGRGYKSTSGGERRRLDLAITFALGEIAAAHLGSAPGTLFVDEAFDALDAQGKEAAAECLARLAEERPVVLITHDELLTRKLSGVVRHVRVEKGLLT